jgi:hypothetical protein
MASMAHITASEARARSRLRTALPALLPILIGLALAAAAIPPMIAGLIKIAGDTGANAIEQNLPATPDELDADIASRLLATKWYASPQFDVDIGGAALRSYSRLSVLPVRNEAAEKRNVRLAIEHLRSALARAPAQPYGWTQLAFGELLDKWPNARVGTILNLSLRTGPQEPNLVVPRVMLALYGWDNLDLETEIMIVRQIDRAARYRTQELAAMARTLNAGEMIRAVLSSQPDLVGAFDEALVEPEQGSALFQ